MVHGQFTDMPQSQDNSHIPLKDENFHVFQTQSERGHSRLLADRLSSA